MKKNFGRLFTGLFLSMLVGCATMKERKAYEEVIVDPAQYKYESFLYEFPDGEHSAEIRDSVENCKLNAAWIAACNSNNVGSYESFIKRYPESKYTATAQQKIIDIKEAKDYAEFEIAYSIKTLSSFLENYPNSTHRAEVEAMLDDETDWEKINNSRSIAAYETYVKEHPDGKYTNPAKGFIMQIDTIQPEWKNALAKNNEKTYKAFLAKYPQTLFSPDAKDSLAKYDRYAWNMAVNKNTIHGYYAYVEKYPEGIYAEEAENRIIDMEIALIQKNSAGEMPKADGEKSDLISDYAIVEFENGTPYELTLYLSGAVNKKKLILDPGESMEVELLNGHYATAASVKAADVTGYAGSDDYDGGYLYSIKFYISYDFNYDWGN